MTIKDNPWQSMTINDNQWQSMTINDNQWHSMTINDNQWHSMTLNETPWHYITYHDTPNNSSLAFHHIFFHSDLHLNKIKLKESVNISTFEIQWLRHSITLIDAQTQCMAFHDIPWHCTTVHDTLKHSNFSIRT